MATLAKGLRAILTVRRGFRFAGADFTVAAACRRRRIEPALSELSYTSKQAICLDLTAA